MSYLSPGEAAQDIHRFAAYALGHEVGAKAALGVASGVAVLRQNFQIF